MDPERRRELAEAREARAVDLDRAVGEIVLRAFTRDAEFVYRALHAAGTLYGASLGGVRESIRRQAVVRALRALPVLGRGSRGTETVYSTVLAGRYPRDQNYACRLFQMDIIYVASVRPVGGVLVPAGPAKRVLTAICVGSRRAFATLVEREGEAGVLRAFRRVYGVIVAKFGERVIAERARAEQGYYTEQAHVARQAARRVQRQLAWDRRLSVARRAQPRTPGSTLGALNDLPLVHGGPGRVKAETRDGRRVYVEDGDDLAAVSDRPFIRPLGARNGGHSWLDDLAELTLRHSPVGREETSRAWHRTHAHLTFMSDAGDFAATRVAIDEERRAAGAERVRWCVVNKSQLPRLSMQIIERFHRTLRSMLAIYYYAYAPSVSGGPALAAGAPSLTQALHRVVQTYNATRHGTTLHMPDALWDNWRDEERYSAQKPEFASLARFPVGTYVEVVEGAKGKLDGKQVVKRIGGLRVIAHNHCTLELERVGPEEEEPEPDGANGPNGANGLNGAANAPLCVVHGIGPVMAAQLAARGIATLAQLRASPAEVALLPLATRLALPHTEQLQVRVPSAETGEHVALLRAAMAMPPLGATSVVAAGSYRRGAVESGDIDALVTAPTQAQARLAVTQGLAQLGNYVLATLASGEVKWQGIVRLPGRPARRLDLHAVGQDEAAFALLYFTGSREFNVALRRRARARGMRLTERALFANDGRRMHAASEHAILALLNTRYVEPRDRVAAAIVAARVPARAARTPPNAMPTENRMWVREGNRWQLRSTWRLSPVPPWMCRRVDAPAHDERRKLPRAPKDAREMAAEKRALAEPGGRSANAVRATQGLRSSAWSARSRKRKG